MNAQQFTVPSRLLVVGFAIAASALVACGSDSTLESAAGVGVEEVSNIEPFEFPELPPEEQVAALAMIDEMAADGIVSASELEAASLEFVECVRRQGFDAEVTALDPPNIEWSVESPEWDEDGEASAAADEACINGYFFPVADLYNSTSVSDEERQRDTQAFQQRWVDCLAAQDVEVGSYDDIPELDILNDPAIDQLVLSTCVDG